MLLGICDIVKSALHGDEANLVYGDAMTLLNGPSLSTPPKAPCNTLSLYLQVKPFLALGKQWFHYS